MGDVSAFQVGGALRVEHPSYIERPADVQVLSALKTLTLVTILDSRQKGKSSLIVRTSQKLVQEGYYVLHLDLQRFGSNVTPEQWYGGMLQAVIGQLGCREEAVEKWKEGSELGPLNRFFTTLTEVYVKWLPRPLVIFVDEIDFLLALPFSADEFFAGIRYFVQNQMDSEPGARATFCLVGVASPIDLVKNPAVTPFNLGTRIFLSDFTREELSGLESLLSKEIVDRIFYWTNGHPYLVQLISQTMHDGESHRAEDVDSFVKDRLLTAEALDSEPNFADTERRLLSTILRGLDPDESRTRILELLTQVDRGESIEVNDEDQVVSTLLLSGVAGVSKGRLVPRNQIYRRVFSQVWREKSLPGAEVRRQKEAARRASRKTKLVAGIVTAALLTLTTALAGSLWRANIVARESLRVAYESGLKLASYKAEESNYGELANLVSQQSSSPFRGWELSFWEGLLNDGKVVPLPRLREDLASSPFFEGDRIAFLDSSGALNLRDQFGQFKITSLSGRRFVSDNRFGPLGWRLRVAAGLEASAMGSGYAISSSGREVIHDNVKLNCLTLKTVNGVALWSVPRPTAFQGTQFSQDGMTLLLHGQTECVVLDLKTGRELWRTNRDSTSPAVFSPDSSKMCVSQSGIVRSFSTRMGKPLIRYSGPKKLNSVLKFSEDGSTLFCGSIDGSIRAFNTATGQVKRELLGLKGRVVALSFSGDGRKLVGWSETQEARIWDLSATPSLKTMRAHGGEIQTLEVDPKGQWVVCGGSDGEAFVLDFKNLNKIGGLNSNLGQASRAKLSLTGGVFGFSTDKAELTLVRCSDAGVLDRVRTPAPLKNFTVLNDDTVVLVLEDNRMWTYRISTKSLRRVYESKSEVTAIRGDAKLGRVAVGCKDGSTLIIEEILGTPRVATIVPAPPPNPDLDERILSLNFSPDRSKVVISSYAKKILVANDTGGLAAPVLGGHTGRVYNSQFSPDGRRIVSNSFDTTARIWDAQTGNQLAVMPHSGWVSNCAWSPDGRRVATGSSDGTLRVFDGETGAEYFRWSGHENYVFTVTFSPDGKSIITSDGGGYLRKFTAP